MTQGALFGLLDPFTARIAQLQAAFTAASQFLRLDRVEIGSTKACNFYRPLTYRGQSVSRPCTL